MAHKVLVLGTGHIGRAIAHLLSGATGQPAYHVTIADREVPPELRGPFDWREFDVGRDGDGFASLLRGYDFVVNALPFHLAGCVARAATQARVHYFDLTEDIAVTRENVMRQVASIKEVQMGMMLPGIKWNTGAEDFFLIESGQLARFDGKEWVLFGKIIGRQ